MSATMQSRSGRSQGGTSRYASQTLPSGRSDVASCSYVRDLEQRVATLEAALQGSNDLVPAQSESPANPRTSSPVQPLASVPSPVRQSQTESHLPGSHVGQPTQDSGSIDPITHSPQQNSTASPVEAMLTDLMGVRTTLYAPDVQRVDSRLGDEGLSVDDIEPWSTSPAPRKSIQKLVTAYLQIADQSLPLLYKPWLNQKLDVLYPLAGPLDLTTANADVSIAAFFVFEVCAIALAVLQNYHPSRITTSMADRYHKKAIAILGDTGLPRGIEGVQARVLIAQYSYSHPTKWSEFKLVESALRSAVDLGLHQDQPVDQSLDALALDIRRRTFWAAYSLERNIVISLELPFCLSDGAISTKVRVYFRSATLRLTVDSCPATKLTRISTKAGLHLQTS